MKISENRGGGLFKKGSERGNTRHFQGAQPFSGGGGGKLK